MKRDDVYKEVNRERSYQDWRWENETPPTVGAFLVYMQYNLKKAKELFSSLDEPEASLQALQHIRKVTALGVSSMEWHGAPSREGWL